MKRITSKYCYFIITVFFALCILTPTFFTCGPYTESAVFVSALHPDLPLEKYAEGELGILHPAFARSYLFVAYRYLSDSPLSKVEQQSVNELWKARLTNGYIAEEENKGASTDIWLNARKKVIAGDAPQIMVDKTLSGDNYVSFTNCNGDAFRVASEELNEKIKKYGAQSPKVTEWIKAQDQVFTNCGYDEAGAAQANSQPENKVKIVLGVPKPLPAGSAAEEKADRDYQIAAANFYLGKYDEAERLFDAIGKDSSSKWSKIAPYLAARSVIRKASLSSVNGKIDTLTYQKALDKLRAILSDQTRADIHPMAQKMIRLVLVRGKFEDGVSSLAKDLIKKGGAKRLGQDLNDYTIALDNYADETDYAAFGADEEKPINVVENNIADLRGKDDITDWILTFQLEGKKSFNYSVQKWQKLNSLPWLVAAMVKADGKEAQVPELLEAAKKVPANSAAFDTLAFHSVRLLIAINKRDEARAILNNILGDKSAKGNKLAASTRNHFLAESTQLSRNLNEFLTYVQRKPAFTTGGYDGRELPDEYFGLNEENTQDPEVKKEPDIERERLIDNDGAQIFNQQLPLSLLKESANSKILPDHLRAKVAISLWVRAILLDNEAMANEVLPTLSSLVPALKDDLASYKQQPNAETKKFTALYIMLKNPAMRPLVDANLPRQTEFDKIDSYRDNWWCSFMPIVDPEAYQAPKPKPLSYTLEFLSEANQNAVKAELAVLNKLDTAPNYFCNQVVAYAQTHKDDARVPEALHLAVKSTRYGCVDKKTRTASKAAFQVLHKNYPASDWTKKTPYFFGE